MTRQSFSPPRVHLLVITRTLTLYIHIYINPVASYLFPISLILTLSVSFSLHLLSIIYYSSFPSFAPSPLHFVPYTIFYCLLPLLLPLLLQHPALLRSFFPRENIYIYIFHPKKEGKKKIPGRTPTFVLFLFLCTLTPVFFCVSKQRTIQTPFIHLHNILYIHIHPPLHQEYLHTHVIFFCFVCKQSTPFKPSSVTLSTRTSIFPFFLFI